MRLSPSLSQFSQGAEIEVQVLVGKPEVLFEPLDLFRKLDEQANGRSMEGTH